MKNGAYESMRQNGGVCKLNEFVWVKNPDIDPKGEWLKVLRIEENKIVCERKDPFHQDVSIHKHDIIKNTFDQIF
jgi:hypothetical protein